MNLDLCYLSARECLNRFRRGSLSPVELLDALIERAEALEPRINAFSFTYFEEAREQAKRAERAWRNGTARPLEGIPVAIKDEPMIEGAPPPTVLYCWKVMWPTTPIPCHNDSRMPVPSSMPAPPPRNSPCR